MENTIIYDMLSAVFPQLSHRISKCGTVEHICFKFILLCRHIYDFIVRVHLIAGADRKQLHLHCVKCSLLKKKKQAPIACSMLRYICVNTNTHALTQTHTHNVHAQAIRRHVSLWRTLKLTCLHRLSNGNR